MKKNNKYSLKRKKLQIEVLLIEDDAVKTRHALSLPP